MLPLGFSTTELNINILNEINPDPALPQHGPSHTIILRTHHLFLAAAAETNNIECRGDWRYINLFLPHSFHRTLSARHGMMLVDFGSRRTGFSIPDNYDRGLLFEANGRSGPSMGGPWLWDKKYTWCIL